MGKIRCRIGFAMLIIGTALLSVAEAVRASDALTDAKPGALAQSGAALTSAPFSSSPLFLDPSLEVSLTSTLASAEGLRPQEAAWLMAQSGVSTGEKSAGSPPANSEHGSLDEIGAKLSNPVGDV